MRIDNFTRWDTAGLRKIFGACLKELRRREGKSIQPSKSWRIDVVDHRTNWVGGFAYYHSTTLTMKLPIPDGERFRRIRGNKIKRWPPKKSERLILKPNVKFSQEVADVFFHELGHCMGVRHSQAQRVDWETGHDVCRGATIERQFKAWIQEAITEDFILQEEGKAPAPKRDFQAERHVRAVANLKKAETRHKRATTLLKKWRTKVRYYEKIRGPIINPRREEN